MPKEPKSEPVSTRVTAKVKKKLEAIAKRRDRKVSHVVNQIIENYVK
jgi:predicted transcriptional regulator